MQFKLLILTTDPTVLKWKSLTNKLVAIRTALNKTKNATWTVDVRYQDLKPVLNSKNRIDQTWYNSISYPIFREGYQEVFIHFSAKQWKTFGLDKGIRGANQVDEDFVGESYGWSDEDTKRGKSKLSQFVQVVLHEVGGHSLARACGVKDITHEVHKDTVNLANVPGFFERYDLTNWQPKYQEGMKKVGMLQTILDLTKKLNFLKKKSSTSKLTGLVERKANAVLNEMKLLGHEMRIVEGFRSIERQNELYAQGRTKPGNIVTNAKGGESLHNYGVAVDFVFRKEGYDASNALWQTFGAVGKKHGFEWGGDWKRFIDRPHLEMRLGYSLKDFQDDKVDYSKYQ
jgi:hypothetical protein